LPPQFLRRFLLRREEGLQWAAVSRGDRLRYLDGVWWLYGWRWPDSRRWSRLSAPLFPVIVPPFRPTARPWSRARPVALGGFLVVWLWCNVSLRVAWPFSALDPSLRVQLFETQVDLSGSHGR